MRFTLQREAFLKPLAQVVNVVERRQTLPVLANFLVQVQNGQLSLTGTDLEVDDGLGAYGSFADPYTDTFEDVCRSCR